MPYLTEYLPVHIYVKVRFECFGSDEIIAPTLSIGLL